MNELVKSETFDLARPEQSLKVAEVLQRFVKEKRLTANIKGKEYPLVEAWLFAGSQLGLYPIVVHTENLSKSDEIKYGATVEIHRMSDDKVMSRGYALCSNKEASKRLFDEYAILSMAQTRAEGKAFRMLLSWIMKAAGFEATPAEEMDFNKTPSQEIDDVPTEGERQMLRKLVFSSTLGEKEKEQCLASIETIQTYQKYQYIETNLQSLQQPFDQIQNPNHTDINKQVKKIAGNGVK
jgi:hypothetical protein